jgi:hypothetical protein
MTFCGRLARSSHSAAANKSDVERFAGSAGVSRQLRRARSNGLGSEVVGVTGFVEAATQAAEQVATRQQAREVPQAKCVAQEKGALAPFAVFKRMRQERASAQTDPWMPPDPECHRHCWDATALDAADPWAPLMASTLVSLAVTSPSAVAGLADSRPPFAAPQPGLEQSRT